MPNIYQLKANTTDFGAFIEDYPDGTESIMGRSVSRRWKPFGEMYKPITLVLRANSLGKKSFELDISSFLNPFIVLSESTLRYLGDILLPRGELLPILTKSKRKKFFGYYPTNSISNAFDKEKSIYETYPNGLMIRKHVLIANSITDDYLFTVDECISAIFVTEKFKEEVEFSGLLGFDFSKKIELS